MISVLIKGLFLLVQIEIGLTLKVVISEQSVLIRRVVLLGETHQVVKLTHRSCGGEVGHGLRFGSDVEVLVYI
jgi:hypothetical protein